MSDNELVKHLFPPRTQVLGVQLRPFSLGHFLTLQCIGSPFVVGGDFKPLELIRAVYVCTLTFAQCLEFVDTQDEHAGAFAKWIQTLGPIDAVAKTEIFIRYLEEGQKIPNYEIQEREGEVFDTIWTPPEQRMRVRLMKDLGLSETEIMDRPLALCWFDYLTLLEGDRALKILTADAIAAHDEAWKEHERVMCLLQK